MQVDVFSLVKRTGKVFSLVLALSPLCAADQEVTLSVQSAHGLPLASVAVGKPFTLVVTLKNAGALKSLPRVEGLSKFQVLGQSSRMMHTQSGGTSVEESSVLYTIVASTPGTYTLGPARFSDIPGVESMPVTVEVIEAPVGQKKNAQNGYEDPKVTLQLETSEVYVGEKVPFVIRFSWQDPDLKPIAFDMPDIEGAKIKEVQRSPVRTERKGDQVYSVLELRGLLYPEQSGTLRIPQVRVEYTIPRNEAFGWSHFFSGGVQGRESAFSQPAKLTVLTLPQTNKEVAGVGSITRFVAQLTASEVPRGEAVTLILSAYGDADFSQMKPPSPELPQSLKHYPSKTTLDQRWAGVQWSYVIQAFEEGVFTIPAQTLTYFDPKARVYKTLRSQPLTLTVTPGALPVAQKAEEFEPPQEEPGQHTPFEAVPHIPFLWFMLLMLIPPIYAIGRYVTTMKIPWVQKFMKRRRALYALRNARRQVAHLEKSGGLAQVYHTVKVGLQQYLELEDPQDEEIVGALRNRGYSEDLCQEVAEFLNLAAAQSSYAQQPLKYEEAHNLYNRAHQVLQGVRAVVFVLCFMAPALYAQLPIGAHEIPEIVPFVVLQLGVLIGWWVLWWGFSRFSSGTRYLILALWILFFIGWAMKVPQMLYVRARVSKEVPLLVGPSENYPSRGMLETHDEVVLVKKEGAWYYISSHKGKGWVSAASIER